MTIKLCVVRKTKMQRVLFVLAVGANEDISLLSRLQSRLNGESMSNIENPNIGNIDIIGNPQLRIN